MSDARRRSVKRQSSGTALTNGNVKKSRHVELKPELNQTRGSGVVLTCGQGPFGQLGLGVDVMEKAKPAQIPSLENIVDISAGGVHSLCLTQDGVVMSWGCNDDGALGRDTSVEGSDSTPDFVEIGEKVVQISAGDSHSAALTEDGKVYAWGSFRDSHSPMGLTANGKAEKLPVLIMEGVAKIASGENHLAMLSCAGKVLTFGCAEQGQLGRISERYVDRDSWRKGKAKVLSPGVASNLKLDFSDLWACSCCTFAKERNGGEIYAFGLNNYFQLGVPKKTKEGPLMCFWPTISPSFLPENGWKEIVGGQHHTIALDGNGVTYAMGRWQDGVLGLGDYNESEPDVERLTPIPKLNDKKIVNVSCCSRQSFAVTDNGEAYGWGVNSEYQLGSSDEENKNEPTLITGKQLQSKKILKVSAGGLHTVFLATTQS